MIGFYPMLSLSVMSEMIYKDYNQIYDNYCTYTTNNKIASQYSHSPATFISKLLYKEEIITIQWF